MEEQNIVKIGALIEDFDFMQITGDDISLERPIVTTDTSHPGLELTGYFENSQQGRLAILGGREIAYITTMNVRKQQKSLNFITNEQTPAIIVTKGYKCSGTLERYVRRKNFPIFLSSFPTYRLIVDVMAFLGEQLATSTCVHGGLLSVYGEGILVRKESGMGRSEIASELIKRGHLLVVGDQAGCYRIHNKIIGKTPELLREMLEIRGTSAIDVSRMLNVSSVLSRAEVNFQVNLEPQGADRSYGRIGIEEKKYENILDIDIPKIAIPVRENRSMTVIIGSAVTNYMLFVTGVNSVKEFEQRVLDYIEESKNKH